MPEGDIRKALAAQLQTEPLTVPVEVVAAYRLTAEPLIRSVPA